MFYRDRGINFGFYLDLIFSTLLKGIPEDSLEITAFLYVLLKRSTSPVLGHGPIYMKNRFISLAIYKYYVLTFSLLLNWQSVKMVILNASKETMKLQAILVDHFL